MYYVQRPSDKKRKKRRIHIFLKNDSFIPHALLKVMTSKRLVINISHSKKAPSVSEKSPGQSPGRTPDISITH